MSKFRQQPCAFSTRCALCKENCTCYVCWRYAEVKDLVSSFTIYHSLQHYLLLHVLAVLLLLLLLHMRLKCSGLHKAFKDSSKSLDRRTWILQVDKL